MKKRLESAKEYLQNMLAGSAPGCLQIDGARDVVGQIYCSASLLWSVCAESVLFLAASVLLLFITRLLLAKSVTHVFRRSRRLQPQCGDVLGICCRTASHCKVWI